MRTTALVWLLVASLMVSGCVALTPVQPCAHGMASYRDASEIITRYGTIKLAVVLECQEAK